jgi:hypothetical protein
MIMSKFKSFVLGVALALPLTVFGASADVTPVGAAKTMTSIQSEPQGRCCVFFMGMWYCYPC